MKFEVWAIEHLCVEVEADSEEDALEIAEERFNTESTDFGAGLEVGRVRIGSSDPDLW